MKVQDLIRGPEFVPKTEAEAILAAISCLAEEEGFERTKFTRGKKPKVRKSDKVLDAIYRIAHAYTSGCGCHEDWKAEGAKLAQSFYIPWPVEQNNETS